MVPNHTPTLLWPCPLSNWATKGQTNPRISRTTVLNTNPGQEVTKVHAEGDKAPPSQHEDEMARLRGTIWASQAARAPASFLTRATVLGPTPGLQVCKRGLTSQQNPTICY